MGMHQWGLGRRCALRDTHDPASAAQHTARVSTLQWHPLKPRSTQHWQALQWHSLKPQIACFHTPPPVFSHSSMTRKMLSDAICVCARDRTGPKCGPGLWGHAWERGRGVCLHQGACVCSSARQCMCRLVRAHRLSLHTWRDAPDWDKGKGKGAHAAPPTHVEGAKEEGHHHPHKLDGPDVREVVIGETPGHPAAERGWQGGYRGEK